MKNKKGFTLLELLIVIAIIAILSVILVIVLNPAETLKKARDTQRMSDLATMKTAMGLYLTTVNPPYLAGAASNDACQSDTSWAGQEGSGKIYYSVDTITTDINDLTLDGVTFNIGFGYSQVATAADLGGVDSTGWLPVNFGAISGGSPISNLPIDPTNTVTTGAVSNSDLVYRYACHDSFTFEMNAVLESDAFTVDDNKMTKDGGNNTNYYEVGTKLDILGAGTDF